MRFDVGGTNALIGRSGFAARSALDELYEGEDDAEEYTAAWFAVWQAGRAAQFLAADAADDDADGDGDHELSEYDGLSAASRVAAVERAAKYAAKAAVGSANAASLAVAEPAVKSARGPAAAVAGAPSGDVDSETRSAEYLWQAARLAEIVGIE